tara:strand:+ start:3050 stop:4636 length:1587 start_codon:yes stop_codon:yes gene_type:complete
MKRIIFSLYVNLNNKRFEQYKDRLLKNKEDYAKSINVDFKFYEPILNNYIDINLYKHRLMRELANQYDEILYVDFDVLFNTNENFFEAWDLSKGIVIKDQNKEIETRNMDDESILWEEIKKRSLTLKYFIAYDLLGKQTNNVINTGVIGASSKHIKELDFTNRLPSIKRKIKKLIDSNHHIRKHYYENNEAIFSYILEKYNIPYQLMDDDWHDIRNYTAVKRSRGKIIHVINKIFETYYKEKTRIVFSLYINIAPNKLDKDGSYANDNLQKSERTKLEFKKYNKKLIDNKKEYAKVCGADWKLFGNDKQYKEFAKRFPNISEYNIINFYKIYLLDELSKKYDYVLYLDFDVVANRKIDFFEYNDVEKYIYCQTQSIEHELNIDSNNYKRDYRAPISKYWNCHALLAEHDIDYELKAAFNTGIVGASKSTMRKLKYFDDIKDTIQLMTKLKNDQDSFYPPKIREQFGYDNETVFGYKIRLNNVKFEDLNFDWHYRIDHDNRLIPHRFKEDKPVLVHIIDKKFKIVFDNL